MTQAKVADSGVVQPTFHGVLRHREFRGLWLAQITSSIGDQLAKIALAILIYQRTNSAFLASLAYAVTFLPALVAGPIAGMLADLCPRREVMIICDLTRAALVGVMCIPGMSIVGLLLMLLAVSAVEAPFAAARSAIVPDIVDGDAYPAAQALGQVTAQVAQIIGFAVGGAVVSVVSARGALGVDVGSFLLSAVLLRTHLRRRPAPAHRGEASFWAESSQGARIVWSSPLLRGLVLISVVSVSLIIATEGLAVSYAAQLHRGNVATGLLTAAGPAGGAVGLALASRLIAEPRRLAAIRLLAWLWPIPLALTVLHPTVPVTIVLWAVSGLLVSYHILASLIFAQALEPSMRGRAFAFARSLLIAGQGIGLLLAGLLGQLLSPSIAIGIAALTGLMVCPLLAHNLRSPGRHRSAVEPQISSSRVFRRRSNDVAAVPIEQAPGASRPATATSSPVPLRLAEPGKQRNWRFTAVVAFAVLTLALSFGLIFGGFVSNTSAQAPVHLAWWALVLGFIVTYSFYVPFQRGDEAWIISLGQLPIVLGLLLGSPRGLLVAALLGAFATLVRRSFVATKYLVSRAASSVEILVATLVFVVLRQGEGNNWATLAAAFVACVVADIASGTYLLTMRKIFDSTQSIREMTKSVLFGLPAGMAASSLGLLSVAAMWTRPTYGLLLVLVGALVIGGSKAYADLSERHQGLNRLYEFQGQLGPLAQEAAELYPVLAQTREILVATEVELAIEGELSSGAASTDRRVLSVDLAGVKREFWTNGPPDDEDAARKLTVVLTAAGRRLGTLSVRARLGNVRGFNRSDLQLLDTLGTHVSNALERGRLLERLREASIHDPLTGLFTLNELSRLMDDDLLRGRSYTLMLCDVARLKDINDSLGHEAGDALLRNVAGRLKDYSPFGSMFARAGGGEFAVAIPEEAESSVATTVARIATGLSGLVQVLGVTVALRTRLGWAYGPEDGHASADLLRRADLALSAAKRGTQRVARYAPNMEVDGLRRLRLVNDLREAIAARAIDVAYQPLVTPVDGRVVGAEALARWRHPELGQLPPDEFIVVAEQSGLIGSLTELVLDKALAQTQVWHCAGRPLRIAVNLSPRCLTDLGLPGMVLDLLARHRLEPGCLTLEITESSVAEDPGRAEAVLERLRSLGVRLSIDDFGTGYSTLASLKRFPVQEVKLDRQFLIDLERSSGNAEDAGSTVGVDLALLTAVVTLGHSLGLEIVAEGVETAAVFGTLKDLGVDILQGYYLGRPMAGANLPVYAPVPEAKDPLPAPGSGSKVFSPIH